MAYLDFGEPNFLVFADPPGQVVDVLDDGQSLGGEPQDRRTTLISLDDAHDEAAGLQPVEQASERLRPDVENLSERGLIEPFVLRQMRQDDASFDGSGCTETPAAIFCRLPTMILSPSFTPLSMTIRLP